MALPARYFMTVRLMAHLPAFASSSRDDRLDAAYIALICLLGVGVAGVAVRVAGPESSTSVDGSTRQREVVAMAQGASTSQVFPGPGPTSQQPSPSAVGPTRTAAPLTETRVRSGDGSPRPGAVSTPPRATAGSQPATTPTTSGEATSGATTAVASPSFCSHSYNAFAEGGGHFSGTLTVTNTSGSAWDHWRADLSWLPAPISLRSSGGLLWASGPSTTFVPSTDSSVLPSGGSSTVTFRGIAPAGPPRVSRFSVQGHTCQSTGSPYGS